MHYAPNDQYHEVSGPYRQYPGFTRLSLCQMVTDLFLIWAPTAGKIESKRLLTTSWSLSKHLRRFFVASYVVLEEGRKIETQDI